LEFIWVALSSWEFFRVPGISSEFLGLSWSSLDFLKVSCEFLGVSWTSSKFLGAPRGSFEFLGVSWSSSKFLAFPFLLLCNFVQKYFIFLTWDKPLCIVAAWPFCLSSFSITYRNSSNISCPLKIVAPNLTLIHVGRGVHQISITLIGGTPTGTEIMD
jgi:hypothetical protein